jgi:hypothetical protein
MNLKNGLISLFALAALTVSSAAYSATATDTNSSMNQLSQACASDLKTYCSDVTAGGHRNMACLKAHEDQLSQGCLTQWNQAKATWKETMKEARNACKDDVQKYCANSAGPHDTASCLKDHMSDLSSNCKSFQQSHAQMGGQMGRDRDIQPDAMTSAAPMAPDSSDSHM